MSVLAGKPAPEFKTQAVMPDGSFKEISLADYRGKNHVLLFFYPLDFTFVCPTEIIAFSDRVEEFKKRGVEVLSCSVDSRFSHLAWRSVARTEGGIGPIQYPMLEDLNKTIARDYDVLLGDSVALRGLFLINKEGKVVHQVVNDLPLGRSVDEALRMVDAVQFNEKHGEVCPADFKPGDKGIKANPKDSKDFFATKYRK